MWHAICDMGQVARDMWRMEEGELILNISCP